MALRRLFVLLIAVALLPFAAACEREGPLERTGEQIDRSAERAGENIERGAERAGERVDNAVGERD